MRAERKVYRREHWYSGWKASTRAADREETETQATSAPAVWFDDDGQRHTNFACEHGAYDCSFCNGRHQPRDLG
jgi:hypothetical protein